MAGGGTRGGRTTTTDDDEPVGDRSCYVVGILGIIKLVLFVVVLAATLWALVQNAFSTIDADQKDLFSLTNLPWALGGFCAFGVLCEALGLLGASMRLRCLLVIHSFFCISCLTFLVIFGGMFMFVGRSGCGNSGFVRHQLHRTWEQAYARNDRIAETTAALTHAKLQCCGIDSYKEFSVYDLPNDTDTWQTRCSAVMGYECAVPQSCCKEQENKTSIRSTRCVEAASGSTEPKELGAIFQDGCIDKISSFICTWGVVSSVLLFVLAGVDLFTAIFAMLSV